MWGQKYEMTTTTTTTITKLNVCIPCSSITIFVQFCNVVYVILIVGIVHRAYIQIYLNLGYTQNVAQD